MVDGHAADRAEAIVDEVVDHFLRQLGAPRDERAAGGAADGGVGVLREGGGAADAAGAREALAAAGGVLGEDVGAPLRVNLCQAISSEYYECKRGNATRARHPAHSPALRFLLDVQEETQAPRFYSKIELT